MPRYIDAEDFANRMAGVYEEDMWEVLDDTPTADVVEVVRCKDCKFYDEDERLCKDTNGFDRYWKPTDFCSYGERRE